MPLATQYKTKEMEKKQRYVRSRLVHLDERKETQMDERDYVCISGHHMSVSESVSHPVLLTPEPPRKKEMKDDANGKINSDRSALKPGESGTKKKKKENRLW